MKAILKVFIVVAVVCVSVFTWADAKDTVYQGDPLADVSVKQMKLDGEKYVQQTDDGRTVTFTPDAGLQKYAQNLFDQYEVPAAAAVVLNSKTGRVITFAQRYGKSFAAENENVALDASPPAASVFKIVTTSALLEQTDVGLNTEMCYHGGGGALYMENLEDSSSLDTACRSLRTAFGFSTNAVFAKLSDRLLDRATMTQYAQKFGFGREIPFDIDVPQSEIEIPTDRLEKARASAGFWHSHLSALHGAMIAQSIAQEGAMLRPYIVDSVVDKNGNVIYQSSPKFIGRSVEKDTAKQLIEAMKVTVARGTARKAFKDGHGNPIVPGVEVAGKTGTLHGAKPFRAYSWFVGLAPADNPEVAIAVLIVNEPKWRIHSSWTAAQILREYFQNK
ncbi:MAG: penicillin-binding protein [Deltaproteobacteria bacterium]|nr:penicillin-binding protein [Deltaproteobacteria bacterium]MBN2670062.1 penicillin-binding protein [Deltaproteobacteria bacterium]